MIDTEALRKKVIDLAIQGKLTEQLPTDGDAESLYVKIQEEKAKLVKEGKIKKEKLLPEIDTDEIPFEIPKNWKWVRVAEIAYLSSGKPYDEIDNGTLYIKVSDMNLPENETQIVTSMHFVDEDNEGIIPINSIIFPKRGGAIATNKKRMVLQTPIFVDLNTMGMTVILSDIFMYVKYWFDTLKLDELQNGTTIPQVNNKDIYPLIIPLPPLEEQKRIVGIIDSVIPQIDVIDTLQQQYESDLSVLKGKIIDAGIRGKLTEQLPEDGDAETLYAQIQEEKAKLIKEGKIKKEKTLPEISADEIPFEIPKNWKWVRLGDISSKISSGNTPAGGKRSDAYVKQGVCFFREQNIYDDGIHEEGMVYISKELLDTRSNSTVLPKDILLNITGGSIGRCAIIPDDFSKGSINQHILIIRMIDERMRHYIHHCLCSPFMQKYIKGNAVGDKDGFSGGRCKNMLIPLPPLLEQERICSKKNAILEQL